MTSNPARKAIKEVYIEIEYIKIGYVFTRLPGRYKCSETRAQQKGVFTGLIPFYFIFRIFKSQDHTAICCTPALPPSDPVVVSPIIMGAISSFFNRVFYGLVTGAVFGATFAILLGIVLGLTIGIILGVLLTIPLAVLAAIILGIVAGASEGAVEFVANALRSARDAIMGLIESGLRLLGPKED